MKKRNESDNQARIPTPEELSGSRGEERKESAKEFARSLEAMFRAELGEEEERREPVVNLELPVFEADRPEAAPAGGDNGDLYRAVADYLEDEMGKTPDPVPGVGEPLPERSRPEAAENGRSRKAGDRKAGPAPSRAGSDRPTRRGQKQNHARRSNNRPDRFAVKEPTRRMTPQAKKESDSIRQSADSAAPAVSEREPTRVVLRGFSEMPFEPPREDPSLDELFGSLGLRTAAPDHDTAAVLTPRVQDTGSREQKALRGDPVPEPEEQTPTGEAAPGKPFPEELAEALEAPEEDTALDTLRLQEEKMRLKEAVAADADREPESIPMDLPPAAIPEPAEETAGDRSDGEASKVPAEADGPRFVLPELEPESIPMDLEPEAKPADTKPEPSSAAVPGRPGREKKRGWLRSLFGAAPRKEKAFGAAGQQPAADSISLSPQEAAGESGTPDLARDGLPEGALTFDIPLRISEDRTADRPSEAAEREDRLVIQIEEAEAADPQPKQKDAPEPTPAAAGEPALELSISEPEEPAAKAAVPEPEKPARKAPDPDEEWSDERLYAAVDALLAHPIFADPFARQEEPAAGPGPGPGEKPLRKPLDHPGAGKPAPQKSFGGSRPAAGANAEAGKRSADSKPARRRGLNVMSVSEIFDYFGLRRDAKPAGEEAAGTEIKAGPAAGPGPGSVPEPAPESEPAPAPEPKPEAGPDLGAVPAQEPVREPEPESEPMAESAPAREPEPETEALPEPEAAPEPTSEGEAVPEPELKLTAAPELAPDPGSEPELELAPGSELEPEPGSEEENWDPLSLFIEPEYDSPIPLPLSRDTTGSLPSLEELFAGAPEPAAREAAPAPRPARRSPKRGWLSSLIAGIRSRVETPAEAEASGESAEAAAVRPPEAESADEADSRQQAADNGPEGKLSLREKVGLKGWMKGRPDQIPEDEETDASVPDELPETDEASFPDELPETDEASFPDELPETDEASFPDELPETDEASFPDELPETDEATFPDELPEPDEPTFPDELPETDEPSFPDELPETDEATFPDELPEPDEATFPDELPEPDEPAVPDKLPEADEGILPDEPVIADETPEEQEGEDGADDWDPLVLFGSQTEDEELPTWEEYIRARRPGQEPEPVPEAVPMEDGEEEELPSEAVPAAEDRADQDPIPSPETAETLESPLPKAGAEAPESVLPEPAEADSEPAPEELFAGSDPKTAEPAPRPAEMAGTPELSEAARHRQNAGIETMTLAEFVAAAVPTEELSDFGTPSAAEGGPEAEQEALYFDPEETPTGAAMPEDLGELTLSWSDGEAEEPVPGDEVTPDEPGKRPAEEASEKPGGKRKKEKLFRRWSRRTKAPEDGPAADAVPEGDDFDVPSTASAAAAANAFAAAGALAEAPAQRPSEAFAADKAPVPSADVREQTAAEKRPQRNERQEQETLPPEEKQPLLPEEAYRVYAKPLDSISSRLILTGLFSILSLFFTLYLSQRWTFLPEIFSGGTTVYILLALLGLMVLVNRRLYFLEWRDETGLRPGLLLGLATAFAALDCISAAKTLRPPFTVVIGALLLVELWGRYDRGLGLITTVKVLRAEQLSAGVSEVQDITKGSRGLIRTQPDVERFMEKLETRDLTDRMLRIYTPVAVGLGLALTLLISLWLKRDLFWTGALIFLGTVPVTGLLAYSRLFCLLARRLAEAQAALCGYHGAEVFGGEHSILIGDDDIFPAGSLTLNGFKVYNGNPDRMIAYAAAACRSSGSALDPIFEDLLVTHNGRHYTVDNFRFYDSGGIGASLQQDVVLMGSLDFMKRMGVHMDRGARVKQAVYMSLNGELAAVFAVRYNPPENLRKGLAAIAGNRHFKGILVTRTFLGTPGFLKAKFGIPTGAFAYPSTKERIRLSEAEMKRSGAQGAILAKDSFSGFAQAAAGGRLLRSATLGAAILTVLGGLAGLILMGVLAALGAYETATALNVLLYVAAWLAPTLLLTVWGRHF